jgi:hypothetical protein
MQLPAQSWTVSCRACDLVIGAVEGGRFVHDAACAEPLSIGAGLLRCCQCGGRLDGVAQSAVVADVKLEASFADDMPPAMILPFARRQLHEDTRQRL